MPPIDLAAIRERLRQHLGLQEERRRLFGDVRDLISVTHQGHRFVAVANRVYYDKGWQTFTDFFLYYVRHIMGKEWWDVEKAKPAPERHPVMKWFEHWAETSRHAERHENGLLSAVPDGLMSALILLAYDLYVLRHHSKLQAAVVGRLRHPDQFLGARYELFVSATFVRAGFNFEYEDETDTKSKHAEFTATFPAHRLKAAVEAKARRRKVLIEGFDVATIKPGVRDLLLNAAGKVKPGTPMIVFLELNLPPEPANERPSWKSAVDEVIVEVALANGGTSPFAAVIFTNRPHVYGQPGEADPSRHVYASWPTKGGLPDDLVDAIGNAATQYGNVPSLFPRDFSKAG